MIEVTTIGTAAGCFAVLHRIRSIRRSVTQPVLQSLVVALVLSRLDYCSTVLFGLPQQHPSSHSVHHAELSVLSSFRRINYPKTLQIRTNWTITSGVPYWKSTINSAKTQGD